MWLKKVLVARAERAEEKFIIGKLRREEPGHLIHINKTGKKLYLLLPDSCFIMLTGLNNDKVTGLNYLKHMRAYLKAFEEIGKS